MDWSIIGLLVVFGVFMFYMHRNGGGCCGGGGDHGQQKNGGNGHAGHGGCNEGHEQSRKGR